MSFGELALINDHRRSARVAASEDCILGVMDKYDYDRVLGINTRQEYKLKNNFLREFRMFNKLPYS